jgi:copper chaperone CopZ
MARPKSIGLPIAKLKVLLRSQESKRRELLSERKKIAKQLAKIDGQIAAIDGGSGGVVGGTRPKNAKSLVAHLEDVLAKQPKGLGVGDIVDAVLAAGYKTGSDNFRSIVNQTLIKEGKKFGAVSRGVYSLKK